MQQDLSTAKTLKLTIGTGNKVKSGSTCTKRDTTIVQNTSANRSGSKVANRVVRRSSKLKVKRTGKLLL